MNKILTILLLAASVVMGARISLRTDLGAGTYNASTASIWSGGVAPANGDSVTINQPASGVVTITFDYSVTLGNNTGNYGHALVINATSETRYAVVQVADGVKLTLRGYNTTSSCAAYINRYAIFKPMPGCTVYVDAASNYQTIIDNRGIIEAIGTAEKPVTFTGQCNWDNNGSTTFSSNYNTGVVVRQTTNTWLSNSSGTGVGSVGNSSLSFSSKVPNDILTNEVSSIGNVVSTGDYYINYHTGAIYYYNTAEPNSFIVNYKYLTFNGWGLSSIQNTTYNEAKYQYCKFEYMGGNNTRDYGIYNKYKNSATSATNRLTYLLNCELSFCKKAYVISYSSGANGDPILINNNTVNHSTYSSTAMAISISESTPCEYINICNNVLNCGYFIFISPNVQTHSNFSNITIRNNTGQVGVMLSATWWAHLYDSYIDSNTVTGFRNLFDSRLFENVGGQTDHPLTIRDNSFIDGNRLINMFSNVIFERNYVNSFLHHGIIPSSDDHYYIENVTVRNNMFLNDRTGVNSSGILETGYNHYAHLHNWIFTGNTIGRGTYALLSLGDTQDEGTYSVVTGLVVENNIIYTPKYGIVRNNIDANELNLHQIKSLDYNLIYNPTTAPTLNYNQQATFIKSATRYNFDATRNVLGVCLFDPNYTLPEATGRSLVFTYVSTTDQTLQWDGGTAVQLVLDNGTCSAAGGYVGGTSNENGKAGTLTDASKSWSTDMSTGTVVRCKWVKITGGTGAGQIRAITNNTATVLTVVPAWTTLPDNTSTYTIIESEVQLFDVGATNYVRAGIYLPELPTANATDENITITKNNLTSNPLLSNASGSTANDHKVTTGSPALAAGIANITLTTDYFGTTRNDPPAMGFYDHEAATVPVITVEPTSQTVDENHTATFSLTATGADSYQWKSKANGNVGTSSNTYAFTATLADNGDSLWCIVTNTYGADTSARVKLTVNDTIIEPVTITVQPKDMVFPYGVTTDTFVYVVTNAPHVYWTLIDGLGQSTDQGVDNDSLIFQVSSSMDGYKGVARCWSLGGDTIYSDTFTLTEANAPPVVTVDPVSDTTTSTVRMFAEYTGDSVQIAWYRFHGSDTILMSRDSVLQFTATVAMHGDSLAAVLYNNADTVMTAKAGIYFVYAVFDSVNTGDSNTIYVHGNFLDGSGWTATLSDSTLTTESGSATAQVFGYNHKITLSVVKYTLVITNGDYTITLYIGRRKSTGNNKPRISIDIGL